MFRKAVTRHLQYAAWAADGQGVDRHLFGLKKMLKDGEPTPAIYTDAAFSRTNHWELSTSNLSSPFLDGWGYGEGEFELSFGPSFLCTSLAAWPADATFTPIHTVVPDGYGLSYSIGDHYIRWTITSLKRDTATLKHYLAEAATETRFMMEKAAAAEAKRKEADKAKL